MKNFPSFRITTLLILMYATLNCSNQCFAMLADYPTLHAKSNVRPQATMLLSKLPTPSPFINKPIIGGTLGAGIARIAPGFFCLVHKKQSPLISPSMRVNRLLRTLAAIASEKDITDLRQDLTILKNLVEEYRQKIGVTSRVEVEEDFHCTIAHMHHHDGLNTIILPSDDFCALNEAPRDNRNYYEALAILCHELGHAKYLEDPSSLKKINAAKKEDYHILYEEELMADTLIPDEKPLLHAARSYFEQAHNALNHQLEDLRTDEHNRKSLPPSALIDFSQLMNEEYAQEWDKLNKNIGDYHPSRYRRAYNFNERLKKLDGDEK